MGFRGWPSPAGREGRRNRGRESRIRKYNTLNSISTYRRVGHTPAHRVCRIPVRRRVPTRKTRSGRCDGQRRFAGHHFFRSVHHGHHNICAGETPESLHRTHVLLFLLFNGRTYCSSLRFRTNHVTKTVLQVQRGIYLLSNRLSTPRHLFDRGSQWLTHCRGRFVSKFAETLSGAVQGLGKRHAPNVYL